MKIKTTIKLASFAVFAATSAANAQTTLGSAANYDIFILEDGKLKDLKDGNYAGQIGIGKNADAKKNKASAVFTGNYFAHSTADYNAETGFDNANNNIFTSGFDSPLEQANADALSYASFLGGLGSTQSFGEYKSSDSGAFSYTSGMNQTVLDFTKLDMENENFTLTGRAGFDDQFIIRISGDTIFDMSDVVLNNLDFRDVIWLQTGTKEFNLHNTGGSNFSGTILSPNGNVVVGDVNFTGAVIANEAKFGTGAVFTGQTTIPIPEPSSSLMVLLGVSGMIFVRRRKR